MDRREEEEEEEEGLLTLAEDSLLGSDELLDFFGDPVLESEELVALADFDEEDEEEAEFLESFEDLVEVFLPLEDTPELCFSLLALEGDEEGER